MYVYTHTISQQIFSMACHKFNGSSSKNYVENIIYSHDSMYRSFCASEHFTAVFAHLPHGSLPGIILIYLDERRVKQRIFVGQLSKCSLLE